MNVNSPNEIVENVLCHYGIKGQSWGIRRFQNEDGSLTPEGRRRYGIDEKISTMTDAELRKAMDRKRLENQYVGLRTTGIREKAENKKQLINAIVGTSEKAITLTNITAGEKLRRSINEDNKKLDADIKDLKDKKKEYNQDKTKTKDDISDLERQMAEKQALIDDNNLTKQMLDKTAQGAKDLPRDIGKPIADMVVNAKTKEEYQNAFANAQRNVNELDEDQLKRVVNRMLLEKEYNDLMNPPKPSREVIAREKLQTLGAFMGIAVAAVTFANGLRALIEKKNVVKASESSNSELYHYRTPGSKNGVRRYQNPDGSLTPEGYRHYGIDPNGRQGGQLTDLEKQRMKIKMEQEKRRAEYKARKESAKADARVSNIYRKADRQQTKADQKAELEVKKENRANIRRNVMKAVVGTAAVATLVAYGLHRMKISRMENAHIMDMEKQKLLGEQKIKELVAVDKEKTKLEKAQTESKIISNPKLAELHIQEQISRNDASAARARAREAKNKVEVYVEGDRNKVKVENGSIITWGKRIIKNIIR